MAAFCRLMAALFRLMAAPVVKLPQKFRSENKELLKNRSLKNRLSLFLAFIYSRRNARVRERAPN